jgi:hypothetical protein
MKLPITTAVTSLLALLAAGALAQDPGAPRTPGNPGGDKYFGKSEEKPENTRSLDGAVLLPSEELAEGAVVQLKDTKTLRVRSYITLKDGKYNFHGLSTDTDYEVKAKYKDLESKTRRLTVYDSRKKATLDLKLEPEA